jgi:hypothetical protein
LFKKMGTLPQPFEVKVAFVIGAASAARAFPCYFRENRAKQGKIPVSGNATAARKGRRSRPTTAREGNERRFALFRIRRQAFG